jgi:hypothetical protein
MLLEIGNGAMNASRCWQLRDETSANTPAFYKSDSQWGTNIQVPPIPTA